ncbi:MAG: glycosyltransferase family 4 protein [Parcubacteria group bacterium]|nr:glycosyltransferase family 4 protein [Parcubacteria group bacterium]
MKNILIFSTAYLPLVGGAEIAVKELTDRLTGFEFDLITAKLKKNLARQEKIGRVMIYRLGSGRDFDKFLLPILGLIKAIRLNRKNNYDFSWAIMASFGALAAWLFKKINRRRPYLLTLQEGDTPEHIYSRAKWLGSCYKKMFTQADFITAISYYLKDFALKQGATAPIEIVPNGVDIKKFSIFNPSERTFVRADFQFSKKEFKKKLKINEDEKIIITVSRLVKKNGVGDLIEATRYLPAGVKLIVIGAGELEKNYKLQITNYKLNDRVLMLGIVKNEDIPQYLALADAFVRPSLSEGQGIAFLEAMAAGVPVIATPVGGIVDFLRPGQTGLFCQVNNPRSIADMAAELLNNKELAEKIKVNARELVVKNYDWDLIAVKMEAIFNSVIARSKI